ncbi:hypothetical protein ACJVC5_06995 [Peredibacter sp. HCB2-198]|uniref:hypothetical protein n=1 Tax=Peredibacter sp. HCB2-198 TaxID=3383025 RepID=UPI0038B68FBC
MKILIIISAMLFSSSVLAHWTSPNGISPKKEEVLPKDVREPSSVQHEKPAPKKHHEKEKNAKGT